MSHAVPEGTRPQEIPGEAVLAVPTLQGWDSTHARFCRLPTQQRDGYSSKFPKSTSPASR
jgi:hypothetical protein